MGRRSKSGAAVVSALHLTHRSSTRLERNPLASQVEFSFRLTKSSKVRVRFVKQSGRGTVKRWTAIPGGSLAIAAGSGSTLHRLSAANRLAPGRYRLTVRPAGGRSRSIYVRVGRA